MRVQKVSSSPDRGATATSAASPREEVETGMQVSPRKNQDY